jgi:hypothetical protein
MVIQEHDRKFYAEVGVVEFPEEHVNLTGIEGNVFAIIEAVRKAIRHQGTSELECNLGAFLEEALSTDYEHFLKTCRRWVSVD